MASCTGPQRIRELFAAQCLSAISLEGESALGDGFQALFCSDRADLFGALSYIERAVEAGRVVVDEAAFTECRAESWFGIFQNGGPCADALRGTVPLGESCGLALECESRRCDVPDMACSGTCVAMGVLDATCTSERDCVDGLVCTASRCVAAPLEGEVCVGLCAEGLFCNAARVCEVQHPEGGACRGVGIGGDCEEDLACRGRICAPRPTADEACWPDYLSPRCADGFRCDGSTCRVPTPIGDTCAVTTECELGARCVAATCTAIGAPGDECAGSEVCALGTGCQDGRCQPLPDLGEACFDAGCFRGVCRDGTCQAQPLLTPCDAGLYVFDALDPCGGNSSCSETSSGWLCLAEGGPGDACGGTEDPSCRQPDLYCGDARACVADCFVGGL